MAALNPNVIAQLSDVIASMPTNDIYTYVKAKIINHYQPSDELMAPEPGSLALAGGSQIARLQVRDSISKQNFLIDSGPDVSILPPTSKAFDLRLLYYALPTASQLE